MEALKDQGRWTIPDLAIVAFAGLVGSTLAVAAGGGSDVVLILMGQFLLTAVAMLVVARVRGRDFRRLSFVVETRDGLMILLGMGLQVLFTFLFLPLAILVDLETEPQSLTAEIAGVNQPHQRVALFLMVGLIGPILEEVMFRGMLIDALVARFRSKGVIFGSSGAFAVFHMLGLSTVQPLESAVVVVPQLFLFGVVLAYLRIMRERLGPAIFAHAGFNLLSLLVILFYPEFL